MSGPFEPQPFGKYYLCERLAVGGMAEIFLARVQSKGSAPESLLVVKRILPHFSGNSQFTDMFIDEARISFLLHHENIVPLHDLGKVDDQFFLAMEWVVGQDLRAVVTRCRERGLRLSFEHAAWIAAQVCRGLDYAHQKTTPDGRPLHLVHRDISPQNVLVGYDGQVKITDFGIAKAEDKLDSTRAGTLKGKFGYMAPEQVVAGGPPIDHRVDVFAVGIILWELLTGQRLFIGNNEIDVLRKVREGRIEPPSSISGDIPRELEKVVFRSLMRDREKRYSSAEEMEADLKVFLSRAAPGFGARNLAAVMAELFRDEISSVRAKWNVTVVDVGKVDRAARQEATRPGLTAEALLASLGPDVGPQPLEEAATTPSPRVRVGEEASRQNAAAARRTSSSRARRLRLVAFALVAALALIAAVVYLEQGTGR